MYNVYINLSLKGFIMKKINAIKEWVIITVATFIVAAAVYFFMVPSNLTIGSISGLAIVISQLTPFSVSQITMVINIVLLAVGFLLIGREFGAKTVYTSLLMPAMLGVFERLFPNIQSMTGDQLIDGLAYCLVLSIGLSMLFTRNASSGGLDIIAKIMNKYLRIDLGKAMGLSGMVAALSSVLVFDSKTVVLSIMGTYFSGIVLDNFIFGSTQKKRVCIISEKHAEILDFILNQLHSGATQYHAYGAYTETMRMEINTIVDKSEYMKLMNYITKTDPNAFMTIYPVSEVMYKPKPKSN